jgi:predicted O-linked N-acetylglucosamine transferase (SPINDLY family)
MATMRGRNHRTDKTSASPGRLAELFATALSHHQAGRLVEAKRLYRKICDADPRHVDALHLLGVAEAQLGNNEAAVDLIGRALALDPDYAEAHHNLGRALTGQGKLEEAIASYERAVMLKPDYIDARHNLGTALIETGKIDAAVTHYKYVLTIEPNSPQAYYNLGRAADEQKRLDEAVLHYRRAVTLKPDYAAAHDGLGTALKKLGRADEAAAHFRRALALNPSYAEAQNNFGVLLLEQAKLEEAIVCFQRAVALNPGDAVAQTNLGRALQEQGKSAQAGDAYRRALALTPDNAEVLSSLGGALSDQGKTDEAITAFERAVALAPNDAATKLALCVAQLPVLYGDEAEITKRRTEYEAHLRALCDGLESGKDTYDNIVNGIGLSQPFYLAYQGMNDRDLQSLYGSFLCRVMAAHHPAAALTGAPAAGEPVRVGIVSGYFRWHSVWKILIQGWITQLDRRRFRVFGYHTRPWEDSATKTASDLCERFVQGPLSAERWRQEIASDAPHILIYPDIGMDNMSAALAAQRLAPVQCSSWGHPNTSGFPTVDYFISSDLMEPLHGQDHYSERLIRLPNLSSYYEPVATSPVTLTRADAGLRAEATVYLCCQSVFKYLPQYDQVFPRVARDAGDCQFVFAGFANGTHVNALFWQRLERAFAAQGLRAADHCVVLPPCNLDRFVATSGLCDVVLDSIGWSGCTTMLETSVHDLPIVTLGGTLMRGRHSLAFLQMMGITETIAESIDDYIAIAARLAGDGEWRAAVKKRVAENKQRLYRDRACIDALEDFLQRAAREGKR